MCVKIVNMFRNCLAFYDHEVLSTWNNYTNKLVIYWHDNIDKRVNLKTIKFLVSLRVYSLFCIWLDLCLFFTLFHSYFLIWIFNVWKWNRQQLICWTLLFCLLWLCFFFFFGIFLFRNRILFGFDYVEVTHSKFYRIFFYSVLKRMLYFLFSLMRCLCLHKYHTCYIFRSVFFNIYFVFSQISCKKLGRRKL